MNTKAIRDLKPGDVVQLEDGNCATINRVYREAIFEGDVWAVEYNGGGTVANGLDRVALAPQGPEGDE